MKTLKPLLFFFLFALTFSACKKDEEEKCDQTTLELVFKGNYAGETLLIDEITEFNYFDNTPIRISNVRFFISEVTLLNNGAETMVLDVADIDFSQNHRNAEEATGGQSIEIASPDLGEFDGIRFGIGLTPAQNLTVPTDYAATHPLGNDNNEYWEGWSSYIFAKLEGRQDVDRNAEFDSFTYHIGFDDLARSAEFTKTFDITEGNCTQLIFNVDVQKMFTDGTNTVDIVNRAVSHTNINEPEDLANSHLIMDGFLSSITLE